MFPTFPKVLIRDEILKELVRNEITKQEANLTIKKHEDDDRIRRIIKEEIIEERGKKKIYNDAGHQVVYEGHQALYEGHQALYEGHQVAYEQENKSRKYKNLAEQIQVNYSDETKFRWALKRIEDYHSDLTFWEVLNRKTHNIDIQCRYTAENGNLEKVKILLAKGARDYNEYLFNACAGGKEDIALYLISLGANNFRVSHKAALEYGYVELAQLIAQYF